MNNRFLILPIGALAIAVCSISALADGADNFTDKGVYVVGQIGVGATNLGFFDDFLGGIEMRHNTGFSGRLGMGYQISRYFAVEGGFSAYPSGVRNYDSSRALFGVNGLVGSSKISNIYSADLMAVLRIPMGNYFFISGAAGIAAMHFSYAAMNVSNGNFTLLSWNPGSTYFVAPKASLKIGTKINQKTSVFVSISYIFSVNGTDPEKRNYQPGLSMASVGMSYSF